VAPGYDLTMMMAQAIAVFLAAVPAWIDSFVAHYRINGRERTMTAAQCSATLARARAMAERRAGPAPCWPGKVVDVSPCGSRGCGGGGRRSRPAACASLSHRLGHLTDGR